MNGKFILINGSASTSCTDTKLDQAVDFVEHVVGEILRRGGGLVTLASDDSATLDSRGVPRIFDWVVLREVERYVESTTEGPRKCARVVMADHIVANRLSEGNLRTLSNLQQRGVVEVERIRREEYTGGRYRELQVELSDAMVAIGGGKGTYICGTDMLAAGKPVLPIDLNIGAFSVDGDGALLLHRELLNDPVRFFPYTGTEVIDKIETLSLDRYIHQASVVAQRAAELFSKELALETPLQRTGIRKLLSPVDKAVGKLVTWIGVVRAIDFFRGL